MVTKINTNERKSIHDGNGSQLAKEDKIKSLTATTKGHVDTAIKARTESLGSLYKAAAHSFYLGIVFGRWEQANRLFLGLPSIDANALRQLFALRVNDKYAVDGIRDKDASGNEIEAWVKRPTTMIQYLTNPANKGEHFTLTKAGEGAAAEAKRKLIAAYRENVEKAGVDDLEAIEWISRDKVNSQTAPYDLQNFQKQLKTLLIKAAKATGDAESGISTATIEAVMRDTALPKAMKAEVRDAYAEEPNKGDTKAETKEEKPAVQVAA